MKSISLTDTLSSNESAYTQKGDNQELNWSLIYSSYIGPQTFYICFTDSDSDFFGKRVLKKGFSHCFALQAHEFGWVSLNPTRAHLYVDILDFYPHEPFPLILKRNNPEITIVCAKVEIDNRVNNFFNPLYCTSMVNYLLGIRWPFLQCITPHQLYKNLINKRDEKLIETFEVTL